VSGGTQPYQYAWTGNGFGSGSNSYVYGYIYGLLRVDVTDNTAWPDTQFGWAELNVSESYDVEEC
jgi:hypothetical protein